MNRQKDTKTRVFVQKLIDDRSEGEFFYKFGTWDFLKYSNEDFYEYLDIDYGQLVDILDDLKDLGVIFQYECLDTESNVKKSKKEGLEGYRTTGFRSREVPSYEECSIKLPDDFLQKAQAYLAGQKIPNKNISVNKTVLNLDRSGNLWYGNDKKKNRYPMKAGSQIFFIFKYLVDNKGSHSAAKIAEEINTNFPDKEEKKTAKQVRSDIAKIRARISALVKKVDGMDVIPENKNSSGYSISENFHIEEWQE